MYKCYDCKNLFEYFDTVKDYIGDYGSAPVYETVAVCPFCKSVSFDRYNMEDDEIDED